MDGRRSKPAYRADQVGSFLRPQKLLEARERHRLGDVSLVDLRALEDRIIIDLLRMQEEIGLSIFSDGEVRREAWYSGFNEAVEGLELVPGARTSTMVWHGVDGTEFHPEPGAMAEAAVRKLRPKGRITAHELQFLAKHAPGPYKITLPSPVVVATFIYREGVSNAAYTRDELLADVTSIMRRELKALSDEGVPYIQVDEGFTRMVSQGWADQVRSRGGNRPRKFQQQSRRKTDVMLRWTAAKLRSACIFVVATRAADGSTRAAMMRSRNGCSTSWTSTDSYWNMTLNVPVHLSHSDSFQRVRSSS